MTLLLVVLGAVLLVSASVFVLRKRLMARFYDRIQARHEAWSSPMRAALLEGVAGTVLEIGPGTGANFPHLPAGVHWIGVEPNVHMHPRLLARAAEHGVEADVRTVTAERMAVDEASVDVVLSTLVLCSVRDPASVLSDVRRVLRPGGRLLFLEHVAAPRGTGLRRFQSFVRPFWRVVADGCCPDRELAGVIEGAGFQHVDIERRTAPKSAAPTFISPHIVGQAVK